MAIHRRCEHLQWHDLDSLHAGKFAIDSLASGSSGIRWQRQSLGQPHEHGCRANHDWRADGNTHTNTNRYADYHTDSYSNSDSNSHPYSYSNSDTFGHANSYSDADTYSHANSHAHSYSDADTYSHAYSYSDADTYRYPKTNTETTPDSATAPAAAVRDTGQKLRQGGLHLFGLSHELN